MGGLVLLPGTLCDGRLFGIPGQVCDLTRDETITGMARRVLVAAPPEFDLAGLSLGGIVAMEIARIAPERVARLALLDTNHRAPTGAQRELWTGWLDRVAAGEFRQLVEEMAPIMVTRRELVPVAVDMALTVGPHAFARQIRAQRRRVDNTPLLGTIACPTLVLCGAHDDVTPPALHEEMATLIPGAELVVVPGAGHLSTLDRPGEVAAELRRWRARAAVARKGAA